MMRVKLLSTSKQLPLKCWYSLPNSKKVSTILDLKKQLVADLLLPCKPDEFMLEMDEFELLKGSKIDDVLRDNDTLSICFTGKKRKASLVNEGKETPVLKKKKTVHTKKIKDRPKKVVKESRNKTTDRKDKSKKKDKKADKQASKKISKKVEKEASKKTDKKETKRAESKKKTKEDEKEKKKKKDAAKNKIQKKTKAKPVEVKVLTQTQRRNLRRKLLKQKMREYKQNKKGQEETSKEQQEEPANDSVRLTAEEQQQPQQPYEQVNNTEMVDYNPYGRAVVTSIECAPNFKKKNNNRNFTPREYPVHKVPPLFYAQHHIESYFVPSTSNDSQYHIEDAYVQNETPQEDCEMENSNSNVEAQFIESKEDEKDESDDNTEDSEDSEDSEEDEDDEEEKEDKVDEEEAKEQEEKNEGEEESQAANTKPVEIDYDTLAVLNFHDNSPNVNDRLAIKILELTSTYTPEISAWKHVLLKQIDPQAQAMVVEFEEGFGKATTKGGKFDIRKKKRRNHWYRGRRQYAYDENDEEGEEEEEEETEKQESDKEEETTATILMTNIFEMRKLN